eukprot:TRINITY_DN64484_c0_g1_i1.p2 TRINITY_DN64484_c0_g1~~TRINITY_DN64484_c0_g1_i1.p2  ORF type:complete len:335 (-),score=60.56 TRINITY_DN64484_c0_g1_i1:1927-2931(-)
MKGDIDVNSYAFHSISLIKSLLSEKVTMTGLCCLEIILGIIVGYYNIIGMGIGRIQGMLNRAKMLAIAENKKEWEEQIDATIEMEYFKEAYELINHHTQLNIEAISWVLKVSNNLKVIEVFDSENEEEEAEKVEIDETYVLPAKEIDEKLLNKDLVEEYKKKQTTLVSPKQLTVKEVVNEEEELQEEEVEMKEDPTIEEKPKKEEKKEPVVTNNSGCCSLLQFSLIYRITQQRNMHIKSQQFCKREDYAGGLTFGAGPGGGGGMPNGMAGRPGCPIGIVPGIGGLAPGGITGKELAPIATAAGGTTICGICGNGTAPGVGTCPMRVSGIEEIPL